MITDMQIAATLAGKQGVMYVPGGAAGKAGDGKDGPNLLLHVG